MTSRSALPWLALLLAATAQAKTTADKPARVDFKQEPGGFTLTQRVKAAGVPYEEIVIPDDTHHWMLHRNNLMVNAAIAEFFERKLMTKK